jgi:hypothetical protein
MELTETARKYLKVEIKPPILFQKSAKISKTSNAEQVYRPKENVSKETVHNSAITSNNIYNSAFTRTPRNGASTYEVEITKNPSINDVSQRRTLDRPTRMKPVEQDEQIKHMNRHPTTVDHAFVPQRVLRLERPENQEPSKVRLKPQRVLAASVPASPTLANHIEESKPRATSKITRTQPRLKQQNSYSTSSLNDSNSGVSSSSNPVDNTNSRSSKYRAVAPKLSSADNLSSSTQSVDSISMDSKLDFRLLANQISNSDWAIRTSTIETIIDYVTLFDEGKPLDYQSKNLQKIIEFVVIGLNDIHQRVVSASLSLVDLMIKHPETPLTILETLLPRLSIVFVKSKSHVKEAVRGLIIILRLEFPPISIINAIMNFLSIPELMNITKSKNAIVWLFGELKAHEWEGFLTKQSSMKSY